MTVVQIFISKLPLSNSKQCKGHEFSIWNLIIRSPSEMKILIFDIVFSSWVNFIKKKSIINFLEVQKALGHLFFLGIPNFRFFKIKQVSIFCLLCSLTLFQLCVGYVYFFYYGQNLFSTAKFDQ